ncbi:MAG: PEP-CTERM sorting domain-containing protein [Verrucomicrobia bacterium]|nr:PEP-CTERM sorting domain-containing protein [Verrucomicrobiota bacterium]
MDDATQTMPWTGGDIGVDYGVPNIVVGKIEWDADTGGEDIITVVSFLQTDVMDLAAFNALVAAKPALSSANWASNKPNLDQTAFDTLTLAGGKFFVDEIRLATTFGEAVPYVPEPGALSLLALGGMALLRRRRAA